MKIEVVRPRKMYALELTATHKDGRRENRLHAWMIPSSEIVPEQTTIYQAGRYVEIIATTPPPREIVTQPRLDTTLANINLPMPQIVIINDPVPTTTWDRTNLETTTPVMTTHRWPVPELTTPKTSEDTTEYDYVDYDYDNYEDVMHPQGD